VVKPVGREGVQKFADPQTALLALIAKKRAELPTSRQ
jgi:hypothetical protein